MNWFPSVPSPDREEAPFGLIGWLQQTRTILPLRAVDCRFAVSGPAAHVEIDQAFVQSNREALDCTYTFPLPGNAAVHRCEITINERKIVAIIEEEKKALELFQEKKADGHRVAMARSERENLFSLDLGNVQPGDTVTVRFAYFQLVERLGENLSLLIPFSPGIRYIPGEPLIRNNRGHGGVDDTDQVPDASRISPPRIDASHPDAAVLRIAGSLQTAGAGFANLSSPTHPVLIKAGEEAGCVLVDLALGAQAPDRDFVVRWQEIRPVGGARSRAWVCRSERDEEMYALAEIVAPAAVEGAPVRLGRDIYFLLDRSGSMQGAKWTKTCEAFLRFLRLLSAEDRAWATLFESKFRDLAEAPLPASQLLSDRAILNLASLGTGGGTELRPALDHVLAKLHEHRDPRRGSPVLILITDGQVGNEAAITQILAGAGDLTVHTFGIDTAVNDAFLRELAETHGGACALMTPNDDITGAVAALAEQLRQPVLFALGVGPGWELPDGGQPRDLFARTTTHLLLRAAQSPAAPVELRGRRPDGTTYTAAIALEIVDNPAIRLLWVKSRIRDLQRSKRSADEDAALALARKHNVLCKGAAFLAWDEAERVVVAKRELYQPALQSVHMLPAAAPRIAARLRFAQQPFAVIAQNEAPLADSTLHEGPPVPPPGQAPLLARSGEMETRAALIRQIEEVLATVQTDLAGRLEACYRMSPARLERFLADVADAATRFREFGALLEKLRVSDDRKIHEACEDALKLALKALAHAGVAHEKQLRKTLLQMLQRLGALPLLPLA